MLFLRKTGETIWKFPLSTNPPISEQFFHDPPLCPNLKNEIPPIFPWKGEGGGGEETMNDLSNNLSSTTTFFADDSSLFFCCK